MGSYAHAKPCSQQVEVQRAQVTFETYVLRGKPTHRQAELEIILSSSATVAVTAVELGVFLGTSLRTVKDTRLSSLPTRQNRFFKNDGLAFRHTLSVVIPPRGQRTVRLKRRNLPLARDLYGVKARVASCRLTRWVGDATVAIRDTSSWQTNLLWGLALLWTAVGGALLLRKLR